MMGVAQYFEDEKNNLNKSITRLSLYWLKNQAEKVGIPTHMDLYREVRYQLYAIRILFHNQEDLNLFKVMVDYESQMTLIDFEVMKPGWWWGRE